MCLIFLFLLFISEIHNIIFDIRIVLLDDPHTEWGKGGKMGGVEGRGRVKLCMVSISKTVGKFCLCSKDSVAEDWGQWATYKTS